MTLTEQVSLDRYSTLRVGGVARALATVETPEDLRQALSWAEEKGLPWFILGGGSNFFCSAAGFPGLVIKMESRRFSIAGREVTAEAGVVTRLAVVKAVDQGLRGIERLAGIPGTIGGAVRGNAGIPGVETKDHLTRARIVHRTSGGWEEQDVPSEALGFRYRYSVIKDHPKDYVVWSATFTLEPGDKAEGERLVAEDLTMRRSKQPYEFPSVGSVFTNPTGTFSGLLIDRAGLKGLRIGGAEVSEKHANFIINRGGATAADVEALIAEVKRRVFAHSGVHLEEEICILRG